MPDKVGKATGKTPKVADISKGNLKVTFVDKTDTNSRAITHRKMTDRQIKNASRIVAGGTDSVKKKFGVKG